MADFNINWNQLKNVLVNNLKEVIDDELPQIKEYAEKIAAQEKQVLEELLQLRKQGWITAKELESELADERVTVKNQLLAIKEMGTAAAQRATNAVIKGLQDFATSAAKAVL